MAARLPAEPAPAEETELDGLDTAPGPGAPLAGQREALRAAQPGPLPPVESLAGETLVALAGEVVMEDLNGIYASKDVQSMTARIRAGSQELLLQIPVAHGRFRLEFVRGRDGALALPNGSRRLDASAEAALGEAVVTLMTPRVENRDHWLGWVQRSTVPGQPGRVVETLPFDFGTRDALVVLRQSGGIHLEVTDSTTGAQLRDVTLSYFASRGITSRPRYLVGSGIPTVTAHRPAWTQKRFASPGVVFLPPHIGVSADGYFTATKPGYGAKEFGLRGDSSDPSGAGKVSVSMDPGATLTVRLVGELPSGGSLGIEPIGRAGAAKHVSMNRRREVVISDLGPGDYGVYLNTSAALRSRSMPPTDVPCLFGAQRVSLGVGEERTLSLVIDEGAASQLATLSGEVLVADGWGAMGELEVTATSSLEWDPKTFHAVARESSGEAPGGFRRMSFTFGPMPLGHYVIGAAEVGASATAVLPAGGNLRVKLRTTVPRTVTVTMTLMNGARKVPWPGSLRPTIKARYDDGDISTDLFLVSTRPLIRSVRESGGSALVELAASGEISIWPPELDGYRSLERIDVRIGDADSGNTEILLPVEPK